MGSPKFKVGDYIEVIENPILQFIEKGFTTGKSDIAAAIVNCSEANIYKVIEDAGDDIYLVEDKEGKYYVSADQIERKEFRQ